MILPLNDANAAMSCPEDVVKNQQWRRKLRKTSDGAGFRVNVDVVEARPEKRNVEK